VDIKNYKNFYKGTPAYVIASGSSTLKQNLSVLRDRLTIGVNQSYLVTEKYNFHPTFMCLSDNKLYRNIKKRYTSLDSKIVFAKGIDNKIGLDYEGSNLVHIVDYINKPFAWEGNFSYNLEKHIYRSNGVVTDLGLPLPMYMGCNPIYIFGCDCDRSGYAYSRKKDKGTGQRINKQTFVVYDLIEEEAKKRGIKIYNAGIGGSLTSFERIDLPEIEYIPNGLPKMFL